MEGSQRPYIFFLVNSFDHSEFTVLLRKERDMLKESQSKSAEQIRRLELDVQSLSEARAADRKYIQELERELSNCSQELEYLQDQLNLRNIEANCLGEHVHSLELKLVDAGKLHEKVSQLKEELVKSNSERFFLVRELENKEVELQNSSLFIEKLEETISSVALESECEIESMKLDIAALEHRSFEAKMFQEEAAQEKARMDGLIEGFEIRFQEAQKMVRCLERENKELREKLGASEGNSGICCQKVEEHLGSELPVSNELGTSEELLGPLLSRLAVVAESDETLKDEMVKMSHQIREYELLVKQLKDELREEKSKAKEEAEDLTQEMAELRYQITGMLEQECKRRACIEQVSLQRIAELESQVRKEQRKSLIATRHFREAQILAESRSLEILHLKNVLKGLRVNIQRNDGCSCGECILSINLIGDCFDKEPLEAEPSKLSSTDDDRISHVSIAWSPEGK
ncbi:hypothetical protein BVC80_9083g54 [Macleaya cordata]|uniref:Uncharacterized protein n=1 Tax=Macleaya cordata TaxID=56857 RepID=A0A200PRD9_MACCD|nr:hypothetical protein BVC80_9083g54 [Macleaya cordata]